MSFHRIIITLLVAVLSPMKVTAQPVQDESSALSLELNAIQDVNGACRLTFLAQNETGTSIDEAVFETVIFDASGGVVSLSLFDFRDLPAGRPRVRQFDLPGMRCDTVGQALINGANSCVVQGTESDICNASLSLGSRLDVELIG